MSEPRSFTITVELEKPSQAVMVIISSVRNIHPAVVNAFATDIALAVCQENHAGLSVVQTYKPTLSSAMFPTFNTRPKTVAVSTALTRT